MKRCAFSLAQDDTLADAMYCAYKPANEWILYNPLQWRGFHYTYPYFEICSPIYNIPEDETDVVA